MDRELKAASVGGLFHRKKIRRVESAATSLSQAKPQCSVAHRFAKVDSGAQAGEEVHAPIVNSFT
jgi:hypothetical protein